MKAAGNADLPTAGRIRISSEAGFWQMVQASGTFDRCQILMGSTRLNRGRNIELNATPIRILVVEDHQILREGIVALLKGRIRFLVVGAVANGQEAIEAYARLTPDVVLMDLQMPVMGGAEATEQIKRQDAAAKVVVLTTFDGDEDVYRAIHAGAKAFLVKDAPVAQLMATLEDVFLGRHAVSPPALAKLFERSLQDSLTARELSVLQLIASGRSNLDIAKELNISLGTVRTHVSHLMDKLGADSRTDAAAIAGRRGLLRH